MKKTSYAAGGGVATAAVGTKAEEEEIKFKKLTPDAIMPTKANGFAAGYDMYSSESYVISPWSNCLVETGIGLTDVPLGTFFRLESRSGLCFNDKLVLVAGIIDSDYEGALKCCIFNFNDSAYHVRKGQKICQGIFLKTLKVGVQPVEILSDKKRGSQSFGSSGK